MRHQGNQKLFWNRANWQSLCAPCHNSWKQALEKGATQ
jgi:5-methylcytosine-specific restriction endonuclease McrA